MKTETKNTELTIIVFLDITQRPGFYLKHNVLEAGFCLHHQVKAYSVVPNWQG
jgi:hypothetical protein